MTLGLVRDGQELEVELATELRAVNKAELIALSEATKRATNLNFTLCP